MPKGKGYGRKPKKMKRIKSADAKMPSARNLARSYVGTRGDMVDEAMKDARKKRK